MSGVFCYRNLNRRGVVWSVRSRKTGRVVSRQRIVVLRDVELKVSQAGRARVLKQKRKNVHAGAQGIWMRQWTWAFLNIFRWQRIKYNPYEGPHFVVEGTKTPVKKAKWVCLRQDGAWAVL